MRLITSLVAALVAAVMLGVPSFAQERPLQAVKVTQAPVLDGKLDDDCWKRPPDADDFRIMQTSARASEDTSVWICYDSKNIYAAFRCSDNQPSKIVAQQKKRGGSISTDDQVAVYIDPWHTHRTTFQFYVTPLGTQVEMLPGAGGSKVEWLGDWHAAAGIDESGWSAEIAIPWSKLKYPAKQDTMGISFYRHHARTDQDCLSPDMGPNFDENLMLDWTGIETPAPELDRVILHYTNVGLGGVKFKNGVDIKQQLSRETNALITINPDFGSVEQSIESIDFSYSPRVLSDNRPFFAEGSQHQDNESRMFYSRDIENVDAGAKFTGQTKNSDFAALMTSGGSRDRHLYYKSRWNFGNVNHLGVAATSTREPGVDNNVASVYGRLGKSTVKRTDYFEYGLMKSFNEGDDRDGSISTIGAKGEGGARQLCWGLWYTNINPDYFAADGIVTDPDLKGWSCSLGYGDEYNSGRLRGWQISFDGNDHRYHSGLTLSKGLSVTANAWTVDRSAYAGISWNKRGEESEPVGNFTIYNDRIYSLGTGWKQNDMYTRGGIDIDFGRQAGGKSFYAKIKQGIKLGDMFRSDLSVEYLKMTGPYARKERQSLASLIYDLSSERSIAARVIERNGEFNLSIGFRQAVRRGEDIYLLFGDPNADSTENRIILKLIRPLF